ncbi:helix-turn-helix transcriptional regulator [Bergeyella sp. RCAD1439]|uniref:helix-turn-helix transcriptional regulator n=1 Tax=Bergeyella anatis TaxID=3113737 RepID=UPI002E178AB7|nr:WYL domain-containing protein [Bergeyella sp. RCAD1439]
MSTNKNAQIRYKALDECLATPYKKFFIEDLIDYCSEALSQHYMQPTSISRRQLLEDLKFMESQAGFEAPIGRFKEGKRVFYRYENPDFSILKKPVSETEKTILRQAMETLNRIHNLPGFDWLQSLQAKLDSEILNETPKNKIIGFEENQYLKGIEYLNPLYHFILKKTTALIEYKGFQHSQSKKIPLSPYFLKQYNNRWFLFGWNHQLDTLQNMPLDRIVAVETCEQDYRENTIDFNDYFDEIIGVTNDPNLPLEKVTIELSDAILPYIQSKPLHGSQKIMGNLLHLEVKINYELKALILSHGENMSVLTPQSLVDQLKTTIEKMKINYQCK